jgi:ribosomal protein S12 methylthiotransferase
MQYSKRGLTGYSWLYNCADIDLLIAMIQDSAMNYVYIENLGCSKNQVDAETMLRELEKTGGWQLCDDARRADLILINTCGFIEPAREESLDAVFSLRSSYPDAKILMTGCLAERYGKQIDRELPEVDGFFGNRDLGYITQAAVEVIGGKRVALFPEYPDITDRDYMRRDKLLSYPGSAYVKISEGCNHRCRYCAIPLIRGSLRSRTQASVVDEVGQLIDRGVYEINLIAQDLAAFGTDRGRASGEQFLSLMDELSSIEGDFLLRMLYIHPDDFPADLPALVQERTKIASYFDIPFQHADERVLRKMGRTGNAESYLDLINSIRSQVPDAVIRSTFLLGFTDEDEQARRKLFDFAEAAKLDWAGMFLYSREEGTPAYRDATEKQHKARLASAQKFKGELEQLQENITRQKLKQWVGREVDVLIEEKIEQEDLLIGRHYGQAPEVDGLTVVLSESGKPGDVIRCRINRTAGVDLEAVRS